MRLLLQVLSPLRGAAARAVLALAALVVAILALLLPGAARPAAAQAPSAAPGGNGRVPAELLRQLERSGTAHVCVRLAVPAVDGHAAAMSEAARCRAYARAQDRFLGGLPRSCLPAHRFTFSPVVTLEVSSPDALRQLAASDLVAGVEPDLRGHGALLESRPAIGADIVQRVIGIDGTGTVVAVIDSGVNTTHVDLRDAIVHEYHYLQRGTDVGPGAEDDHGHGSNVSSIIASRGTASPRGIAPGASLVALKVLDSENRGWISDWVKGVEHVVQLHDRALATARGESPPDDPDDPFGDGVLVDAINMSIVTDALFEGVCDDPPSVVITSFAQACQAAADRGIIVVGASGNAFSTQSMSSPACFSSVISVGSVSDTQLDAISSFTNRNSLLDILAPGQTIEGIGLGDSLISFRGTSQAAPHVTATASLLREVRPALTPEAARFILRDTGAPVLDAGTGLTFPRLDALHAVVAARAPVIRDLTCAYDAGSATVGLTWLSAGAPRGIGAGPGVDDTYVILVRIARDGALDREESFPLDTERFTFAATAGGAYEVCVVTAQDGVEGEPACCELDIPPPPLFMRSDCDGSGDLDISDAVFLLVRLFRTALPFPCLKACDTDDSGTVNLTDAVATLDFMFASGPAPPPPFAECGADSTSDDLDCSASTCP